MILWLWLHNSHLCLSSCGHLPSMSVDSHGVLLCFCVWASVSLFSSGYQSYCSRTPTNDCRRIDVFKLWYWRRLLRVPWTTRRSSQPILKKINPEYSLEGLILKFKLQYFGHLMQRANSLEKTLMLGKIEGRRRRG